MTILEKQPSLELLSLIKAAAQSLLGFGELWNSIKMKGKDEGFSERELQDILRPLLKPQLNKDQIYYLFNADEKKEQSKEQYHRNIPKVLYKQDIEQSPTQEEKDLADEKNFQNWSEHLDKTKVEEEEPTELELANIKIAQLEDALHQIKQFKPATALTEKDKAIVFDDEVIFEFLHKRDNGINIFYFDNYGRDLFQNRIISQLKNSGVKTFKRLYFEV